MEQKLNSEGKRYLLSPLMGPIIAIVAFNLAAGSVNFFRAWIAFGVNFVASIVVVFIVWKFAPDLANQRGTSGEGTKSWDKAILKGYFSLTLLISPIVAGLDVVRFKLSYLDDSYIAAGIALYIVFYLLFHWAMLSNEHFEGTSRIQNERSHKVIMNGPYQFVRHPGYIAMIISNLAYPFVIGSLYSFIPTILAITAIVVRTFLEDRMLQNELEGYSEYTKETRFRLLPGII